MAGSIRRRGERSWELKVELGRDPLGRRLRRFYSHKGTRRQAEVELARLVSESATGVGVDPSRLTVAEFLDRWDRDWASMNVSPKTLERYRQLVRLNLVPHIGQLRIQKLRPSDLNELYARLCRAGGQEGRPLSARTVGHVHRVLHRALGHAVQWGVVGRNAADNVNPPRVEAAEVEILRAGDVKGLLDKLRGRSLYIVAVLGLTTGMRRGEMLATRWRDVDFVAGRLRVERSLEQTKAGGLRFKAPKTRTGRRTISIPPALVGELKAHRKAQQERWLALGLGRIPDDALVLSTWDGQPRTPNALSKDWSETMADLGIKVTLHALRHTHASQLIFSGVDVVMVSRRLGHASPTITLSVYGHMFSNTDDRAAEIMESAFARLTD
jgi:integrase